MDHQTDKLMHLPEDCDVAVSSRGYCIFANSAEALKQLMTEPWLKRTAKDAARLRKHTTLIFPPNSSEPYEVPIEMALPANDENNPKLQQRRSSSPIELPNLYTASREKVWEQVGRWQEQRLVVTITSMVTNQCMFVNEWQMPDRGHWNGHQWQAINFLALWRDSFQPGRHDYHGDLITTINRDRIIPNFYYHIRRPSGALGAYYSNYLLIEDYLGAPVRVAVSEIGNWEIVEDEEMEPIIYRAA